MHTICRGHDDLWQMLAERLGAVEGVVGTETFMELRVQRRATSTPASTTPSSAAVSRRPIDPVKSVDIGRSSE